MFGKLFKKKEPTMIVGEKTRTFSLQGVLPVAAYITIKDYKGGLSENIESKLTVGSEVGDLLLDDPTVSPRHCTFLVSKDVVSVIDHSSHEGTYVNGKSLDAGKTYIVSEGDTIMIGGLEAAIEFKELPMAVAPKLEDDGVEGESFDNTDEFYAEPALQQLKESPGTAEMPAPATSEQTDDLMLADELNELDEELGDGDPTAETTVAAPPQEMPLDMSEDLSLDMAEPEAEPEPEPPPAPKEERNAPAPEKEFTMQTAMGMKLEGQKTESKAVDYYIPGDDIETGKLATKSITKSLLSLFRRKDKEPKLATKSAKAGGRKKTVAAKKGKKGKKVKIAKPPASGIINRFFSLVIDSLFALSIHEVFKPIEEYKSFFDSVPGEIHAFLTPIFKEHVTPHYNTLIKDFPIVQDGVDAVAGFEFLNEAVSFFVLIVSVRILTTLLFRVSIGQFFIGVRDKTGTFITGRLKGILRELIGFLTFPLIIFDLPALINKRTFKEFLSFTRLTTPFSFASIVMTFVWVPLFVFIYLASPLFKGAELKPEVIVDASAAGKTLKWTYKNKKYSEILDLSFDSSDEVIVLPLVEISMKEGKRIQNYGLVFFNEKSKEIFEIRKSIASLKMRKVFLGYIERNPLAEYFQPKIYELAKDVSQQNENFQKKITKNDLTIYNAELQSLILDTFSLSPFTVPDFVVDQGFFFQGHIYFRETLENILANKIEQISLTRFANQPGLLFRHKEGRTESYSYLPQTVLEPPVYKISQNVSVIKTAKPLAHIRLGRLKDAQDDDPVAVYLKNLTEQKLNTREVQNQLADRFKQVAKTQLELGGERLASFKSILSRNMGAIEATKNQNQLLFQSLTEIQNALNKSNYSFFGLTKPQAQAE